jgi:hypothetical protein
MGQDKMKPRTSLGTPLKVEIPLCEHRLSTWPMTVQSGAGVCGVRLLTWCTCYSVPDINICNFSLCKELYEKEIYKAANLYLLRWPGSFASPWGIINNVKAGLGMWAGNMCQEGNASLGPRLSEIQGNEDAATLARKGLNNLLVLNV